ncbi:G-protein coupled receptor 143 isoform X2 [Gouania willdenowi]|uniref:G-protein coupled receptor 143 isoform X2 n=1 Tax=Gouania willdenowi TaxID=441366 RepID=UPI001056A142|nr:G-protein coupled receptor 143 isoform X2 [Gouania willdenowi]
MASPRLETFCCPNRDSATEFVVTFQPVLFGALSLCSAAFSFFLTVLQVLPKRKSYRRLGHYPVPRPASSTRILLIISVCDLLGCAGIIMRSSVWLGLPTFTETISVANSTDVWPEVFCVGSAMWIQLFFSASFWWSFCYAVDVFLVVKTSAGISCEQGLQHAVPHYVTIYAPMLLVLIANPVFFSRTISAVTSLLKGRQGIYTENERRLANEIKIRFFKIMLVFFICWVPNLINESLLFYLEVQADINDGGFRNIRNAVLITWFIMGILNPMQAFLNTLAFHGWTGFDVDFSLQRRRELAWDSLSTSAPNANSHNPIVGTTLLFQSHVQGAQKNVMGKGEHASDGVSVLSEGSESSTVEIHISSELQDYEDVDADGESLENSVRH